MSDVRRHRQTVPRRSYDLALVGTYAVVAVVVLEVAPLGRIARTLLAGPLILLSPGYAVVAAALPTRSRGEEAGTLDGLERLVAALGTSVALVVVGSLPLSLAYSDGLEAAPYRELLAVTTVLFSVVAFGRRLQYPGHRRDGVPDIGETVSKPTPGVVDGLLSAGLVVAMVVAVGAVAYGLATPHDGTSYTSASLLTEGEDGDVVAGGYPDEVTEDEAVNLVVAIENRAGTDREYTVVAVLERPDPDGGGVVQRRVLGRETVTVEAGETVRQPVAVRPTLIGGRLRLSYYVYRGDPSDDPDPDAADRHLYIWLSVVAGNGDVDAAVPSPATTGDATAPAVPPGGRW